MDDHRLALVVKDLVTGIHDTLRRHRPTLAEYRTAVTFLDRAARAGELPLLLAVVLESVVDEASGHGDGTETNVEGPFYVPGAPALVTEHGVATLPMRPDEPGRLLTFTGSVRSLSGDPVPDAELDLWQADDEGRYSHFDPAVPDGNLRGRVQCATDGTFAVRTRVPAPYDIPQSPGTTRVLELLGLGVHRPAHLHLKIRSAGRPEFTTQVYFVDDPWLDQDATGAAKRSLATELKPDTADPSSWTCHFDFVLAP